MPNHTRIHLIVSGPKKDIEAFVDFVDTSKNKDGCFFDFNKIVPMPEEIRNTTSPSRQAPEVQKRLKDKYGFDNWYDWSVWNWGTKWNAYDFFENWNISSITETDSKATITFHTAWDAPEGVIDKAALQFSSLKFEYTFADEGGAFVGRRIVKNDESIEDSEYDWNSPEGKKIRGNLGYYGDAFGDEDL